MIKVVILVLVLLSISVSIECRRNLRDYIVSHEYSSGLTREEFSVYDPVANSLLCRLETSGYSYNRYTNLVMYPSYQTIGLIRDVWSPFSYQGYFNVLDDELNQWMNGYIFQRYRPQGFRLSIEYGGHVYIMENRLGSLITDIRDEQNPNYLLTRFQQTYIDPLTGSMKYAVKVFTNDLPDPIYMMALYAYDSIASKKKLKLRP
ncbi:unnamed protein product [Adineta ricciae]|uniref:Uncharacterized protein n=1 Tax=Adineta ricciae TaxID=249248 RepID=A0A813V1S5_ADIRI|nr:unnamed protein product [Adineta ricciae]CAF1115650.1 unnamed protein product [Adineta ricciae]